MENSREAFIQSVKEKYRAENCIISIKRSKPGVIYFGCNRSGKYRQRAPPPAADGAPPKKTRTRTSRLVECPFGLKGRYIKTQNKWMLDDPEPGKDVHNHELGEQISEVIQPEYDEKLFNDYFTEFGMFNDLPFAPPFGEQ
jgi:hypothetical protein